MHVLSHSWFQYRQRVSQLNAFLIDLMRRRWAARQAGNAPARGDILDRILAALEVRSNLTLNYQHQQARCSVCWPSVQTSHQQHALSVFPKPTVLVAQSPFPASLVGWLVPPCCCAQGSGTKWSAAIETQLCYEIKTFLLAGHETSAAMLMWSVYELGKNSQARDKVSCCSRVRCLAWGRCAVVVCRTSTEQVDLCGLVLSLAGAAAAWVTTGVVSWSGQLG